MSGVTHPRMRSFGAWVVAAALASSLVAGTAWGAAPSTKRASVNSAGVQAHGYSQVPAISADGRLVAFDSTATNLVTGDTNGYTDIFVRDLKNHTTRRVSVSSAGRQGNGDSNEPSISGDGRFVVFTSSAANLGRGDTNGHADVFIRDLKSHTTKRVSRSSAGFQGNRDSYESSVSAHGRYVAFFSDARNLVEGDTNGDTDVFVRDTVANTTKLASRGFGGGPANGFSGDVSISGDGRYVAFGSDASNLVRGDNNSTFDIFVRDMATRTTTLASRSSTGEIGDGPSNDPAISANGRFVAFDSDSTNLTPGDTSSTDVFLRDLQARTTKRVSRSRSGGQADGGSYEPSTSGNGQIVAFYSYASNLAAGPDTNGKPDIYVRDMKARITRRVTRSYTGGQAHGYSFDTDVSDDGGFVAFESGAPNLVANDTNHDQDIFVWGPLG